LCKLMDITKLRTTSYKASTNAQIERFHRTLNMLLGRIIDEDQRNWDECLPYVLSAYRSSVQESTGYTPNFLMFGRETNSPLDLMLGRPENQPPRYIDFVEDRATKMETAYELTRQHLRTAALRNKHYFDARVKPRSFKVGQWVWLYIPRRRMGLSPKWQRLYTGPYLVIKELSTTNVMVQRSKRSQPVVTHVDKLKLCYSDTPPSWLHDAEPEQPSVSDLFAQTQSPTAVASPLSRPLPIARKRRACVIDPPAPTCDVEACSRPKRAIRPPARYSRD
jgi:hypothetical protein